MKALFFLIIMALSLQTLARPHDRACEPGKIQNLAERSIDLLINGDRENRRGNPGEVRRKVIQKLEEIVRISANCKTSSAPQPPPYSPAPTCTLVNTGNGYRYLKNGPVFDSGNSEYYRVNTGARLELVDFTPVFYRGKKEEGVKLRVIYNPSAGGPSEAQAGQILYEYKIILKGSGCDMGF